MPKNSTASIRFIFRPSTQLAKSTHLNRSQLTRSKALNRKLSGNTVPLAAEQKDKIRAAIFVTKRNFSESKVARNKLIDDFKKGYQKDWKEKDYYERTKLLLPFLGGALTFFGVALTFGGIYNKISDIKNEIEEFRRDENINIDQPIYEVDNTVSYFVERQELQELLKIPKEVGKIVIFGSNGMGKTELAKAYAENYARESKDVVTAFLIRCSDETEIEKNYRKLAKALNIPKQEDSDKKDIISKINEILAKRKNWLLIFDDVREYTTIEKYIPQNTGRVIITTTNNQLKAPKAFNLSLDQGMSPAESASLLTKIIGDIHKKDQIAVLAEHLRNIPLALMLSANYLAYNKESTIYNFLNLVDARKKELKLKNSKENTLITRSVINVMLDTLKSQNAHGVTVSKIIALLSPINIPIFLINSIYSNNSISEPTLDQQFEQHQTISLLENYGLICKNKIGNAFNVHSIIQNTITERFQDGEYEAILLATVTSINKLLNFSNINKEKIYKNSLLIPHTHTVVKHFDTWRSTSKKNHTENVTLWVGIARLLATSGNYYMQGEEIIEESHSKLIAAKNLCEETVGNLSENTAEDIYNKLIKIDKQLPAIYAITLHYLGKVRFFYMKMQTPDNERLLNLAVDLSIAIDSHSSDSNKPEDVNNNPAFNNTSLFKRVLAAMFFELGRLDEANRIYDALLKQHPDDPINDIICLHQLAKIYKKRAEKDPSKFENAMNHINLAINKVGNEYQRKAELQNTLGSILLAKGDLDGEEGAIAVYNDVIESCSLHNLNLSFITADAHYALATIYQQKGRIELAYKEIEKCINIRKTIYPKEHRELVAALQFQNTLDSISSHTEALSYRC